MAEVVDKQASRQAKFISFHLLFSFFFFFTLNNYYYYYARSSSRTITRTTIIIVSIACNSWSSILMMATIMAMFACQPASQPALHMSRDETNIH